MIRRSLPVIGLGLAGLLGSVKQVAGQDYERREFVQGVAASDSLLPLPFDPKDAQPTHQELLPPDMPGDRAQRQGFRLLRVLEGRLKDPGAASLATRLEIGRSEPSTLTARGQIAYPARPIYAAKLSTRRLDGQIDELRFDGSRKGQAVVVTGFHPREVMAYEAVVRRFEKYLTKSFKMELDGLDPVLSTRRKPVWIARPRSVFFAENVVMSFAPLMNPSGIKFVQDRFNECQLLMRGVGGGVETNAGDLRSGRLQRGNLELTDGVMGDGDLTDPDALLAVDANRALTNDSTGDMDPKGVTYRGWRSTGTPTASAEVAALYSLLDGVFSQTGGNQNLSMFPRARPALKHTGAALLDVHTPLARLEMSALGPLLPPGPDRFLGYAAALASVRGDMGQPIQDAGSRGTAEYLIRNVFGVPGATLELRRDALFDGWLPTLRGANIQSFVTVQGVGSQRGPQAATQTERGGA